MKNSWLPFAALLFSVQVSFWAATGLGFFEQPLLIRSYGHALADTALPPILQNAAFAVRLSVALLSDLYSPCGLGHRLPYVFMGQLLTSLGFVAVGLVSPFPGPGWGLYLTAALLRSLAVISATCAVDGLIVDAKLPENQGLVQQVRATGTLVGLLLTNLGGGALADAYGLPALAFFLAATAAPLLTAPLIFSRAVVEERPAGAAGATKEPVDWAGALRALRAPTTAAVMGLAVLTFGGQTIGNFALTQFLVDRKGLSLLEIGYLGTIFAVCAWPGSLLAGWALDRYDVRATTAAAQAINALLTGAVLWTPLVGAFAFNAGLNVVGGFATGYVASVTLGIALRAAPSKLGASFMAVIQGAMNAAGLLGNVAVGQIATLENKYLVAFVAGAAVLGAGALCVPFLGEAARPPHRVADAKGGGGQARAPANLIVVPLCWGLQAEIGDYCGVMHWASAQTKV